VVLAVVVHVTVPAAMAPPVISPVLIAMPAPSPVSMVHIPVRVPATPPMVVPIAPPNPIPTGSGHEGEVRSIPVVALRIDPIAIIPKIADSEIGHKNGGVGRPCHIGNRKGGRFGIIGSLFFHNPTLGSIYDRIEFGFALRKRIIILHIDVNVSRTQRGAYHKG
jgi:hypothetical protein